MLNFIIFVLMSTAVLWVLFRLVAWTVVKLTKKIYGIDLKINDIGFFTVSNVHCVFSDRINVKIERIWLSSCYFSAEARKPFAVCLGDVRIEAELAALNSANGSAPPTPTHTEEDGTTQNQAERIQDGNPPFYLSILKMMGVKVENLNVILLRGPVPDCIFHITAQEVLTDVHANIQRIQLLFYLETFSFRMLKSSQDTTSTACLAEATFTHNLDVELSPTDFKPEAITFSLIRPHVKVTEGLFLHLQERRDKVPRRRNGAVHKTHQRRSSLLKFVPKKLLLQIEETDITVVKEVAQRNLNVSFKSVSAGLDHQGITDDCFKGKGEITIKDFIVNSSNANLAATSLLNIGAEATEQSISINTKLCGGFFGYHQEEIQYWVTMLSRVRLKEPSPRRYRSLSPSPSPVETPEEPSKSLQFLCNRSINVNVNIQAVSLAVAMATCPGLKGGVTEVKISCSMIPMAPEETFVLSSRDVRADLDVNLLYVKLAEGGVATSELSSKQHHWNTLLYLGTLIIKANKYGEHGTLDAILDSLQVELSTKSLSVISQLLCAILKLKSPAAPEAAPPVGEDENFAEVTNNKRFLRLDNFTSNVQCTNVNLFCCNEKKVFVMLRNDSIDLQHKFTEGTLTFQGIKLVYLPQSPGCFPIARSQELHNYVGHLKHIKVEVNADDKAIDVNLTEEVFFLWTAALHICVFQTVWDMKDLITNIRPVPEVPLPQKRRSPQPSPPLTTSPSSTPQSPSRDSGATSVNIRLRANILLAMHLQKNHKVSFSTPEILVELKGSYVSVQTSQLSISCDQHDVFKIKGMHIHSQHHSDQLRYERTALRTLTLDTNKAWVISFDQFHVIFPYGYDFADCLEGIKNVNKFRKVVHKVARKPFTSESPLPPDLVIKFKSLMFQICDDPFEVKLGDNYELLIDESHENEKRVSAMDKRIQEIRKTHGLLPANKVDELYASLSRKSAEVYIQRSRQLYTSSPIRSRFWTWAFEDVEIMALADTSIHGRDNCVKVMKEIDPDSPLPDDLEFVTQFCRMVNVSCKVWTLQLRDFPQPLMEWRDKHVFGRLVVAEQRGSDRARRTCTVEVGAPWDDIVVERNMPALKFYHDFSCDLESLTIAYGPCLEPSWQQFNHWSNLINRPSVDPSRPMPFWDKMRLLLHGRLTMSVERMSWLYHCSLDPYNTTEFMDWTWTKLILDWTNAKWVLKGNLDIYAKTASKYDDCRLLHLPNLRFCIKLGWLCHGDPNDHHAVQPCAPNKIPEYSMQEHDSFRAFRSQGFDMNLSFDVRSTNQNIPCFSFYASTLRWLDKIKMCMARVARPIRRGRYWGSVKPRKPQLTRHIKNLRFSFNVPEFQVCYWMSFAKQSGVEMKSEPLSLDAGLQLHLVKTGESDIKRRSRADWGIQDFKAELNNATVWLCAMPEKKGADSLEAKKYYFLSVDKVTYRRAQEKAAPAEEISINQEEDQPTHRVQVQSLKAKWTPLNRNVAIMLYDGYMKARDLKKSLSSDALKGFKVDNATSPTKMNRSMSIATSPTSIAATPSPLTKIQSGPAYDMLQKLVSETDSKFVAIHEESTNSGQVENLQGRAACQTNDVTTKKWHVELYNSQALLRGCESAGYVIVSAAKASLLACDHHPVWRDRQIRSKSTLVGTIDCMQYYATVDPQSQDPTTHNTWLNIENIDIDKESGDGTQGLEAMASMLGSGQSVGGVVTDTGASSGMESGDGVQLQRVISRCRCEFFYAGYGEVEPDSLTELPPPPDENSQDVMKMEEGVDTFSLLHHDLNICTNSLQYLMILDIVNNLLLYVEPRKKEQSEKLQDMKFKLHLTSNEDQKMPIVQRQNSLRKLVANLRLQERELYQVDKQLDDDPFNDELVSRRMGMKKSLDNCKKHVNTLHEELSMMLSCYKESQLLKEQRRTSKMKKEAPMVRRNEVCFKKAEWRMTEADGQIGIADLFISDFLYTKTNKEDDSGAHNLEIGYVKVTNLLPDSPYRDVLVPQDGQAFSSRQVMLRILCKFKAPVGGISIKEHFEVNVVPIVVQLTHRFYQAANSFFFEKRDDDDDDQDSDSDIDDSVSVVSVSSATSNTSAKSGKNKEKEQKQPRRRRRRRIYKFLSDVDHIDQMKERAAQNNMFVYIKIPEVPLRISYKSEKEKNIKNIHDFKFLLPMNEYHNQTWTWRDFAMSFKNDSRKVIIGQAVKQKLHIKTRSFLGDLPKADFQAEDEKAKLLFGNKLFGGMDKSSSRKNLFGNKPPKT